MLYVAYCELMEGNDKPLSIHHGHWRSDHKLTTGEPIRLRNPVLRVVDFELGIRRGGAGSSPSLLLLLMEVVVVVVIFLF